MHIFLNGSLREVPEDCTVARLLLTIEAKGRLAVEVNGEIIPRSEHESFTLKQDDRVEVVRAIGGG
jgi:sulfur carrier protein